MDKNETPINIYLDLSKTFDTLDHQILLKKNYDIMVLQALVSIYFKIT